MGLFRRDKAKPDPALPFLTVADADTIRRIVQESFAEHGITVSMHRERAVDATGRSFGLWNVAAACHQTETGPADWPAVVQDHVRQVVTSIDEPDPFAGLTHDEVRTRTFLRFFPEDAHPELGAFPHREFLPGVLELLALDLPETVAFYNHADADRFGGYDTLREHAIRNIEALPLDRVGTIDGSHGSAWHVVEGTSVYTAGKAAVLPDLAAQVNGQPPGDLGWLVAIPSRHQVVWHCIRDETVFGAVQGMGGFAGALHAGTPGPVSPHVYWTDGQTSEQLTHEDADGDMTVIVSPHFQEILERIAGARRPPPPADA